MLKSTALRVGVKALYNTTNNEVQLNAHMALTRNTLIDERTQT